MTREELRAAIDRAECVLELEADREEPRSMLVRDERDETDDPALNEALAHFGWRTEWSLIPGHKRVFDDAGFVNVMKPEQIWAELRERLERGRKP